MIGDREHPDDDDLTYDEVGLYGPMDAMTRLSPPMPDDLRGVPMPPAWVERYARLVIIRHTFPEGDSTAERMYPSEAQAVRGMAAMIGTLLRRGYAVVDD